MRLVLRPLLALAALLATTGASLAQTGLAPQALPQVTAPDRAGWRLSLGAGAFFGPDYPGSNDWKTRFVVAPDIRYGDDTFFLSIRDGVGATLLRNGAVSAGPLVRLRFGRDQDDNSALRGLGDIDASGEAGVFVRYADGTWVARGEVRQGFGGHSGVLADASLDRVFRPRPDLILTTGPRVNWGSRDFADTYFGITPDQAARSGYQTYRADDYWLVGMAASATYIVNQRMAASLFGEVGQILGSSADSPLVDQRGSATQGVVGLVLSWRFLP
jgi:outer membrane protein